MTKSKQAETSSAEAQLEHGESRVSTKETFENLKGNPEFEKFIMFQIAVGQLDADIEPTKDMKSLLVAKFNQWKKQGSPNPVMPSLDVSIRRDIAFYRLKSFGDQKFYARKQGGGYDGLELEPIIEEVEIPVHDTDGNVIGQKIQKTGKKTGDYVKNYTRDFKVDVAEEAIEEAIRQAPDPSKVFFYCIADKKYTVSKEEFLMGNFDDLVRIIKSRR